MMATTDSDLTLVDVAELANRFGGRLPHKWIRDQAKAGTIPHIRIGRQILFNLEVAVRAISKLAGGEPAGVPHAPC